MFTKPVADIVVKKERMIIRKMLTMFLNIDEKKEKLMWELGFLAVYAVLLTVYFIDTTVVALKIPALIPNHLSYRLWIRLFAIAFVVLKTVRDERFSWKELIFTAIILISFGRCAQVAGYVELVDLAVLIIGARNVSFKKILMVHCGVSSILLVGIVGASLAGVIEDWVFNRWGVLEHSYGFMYPNEFGAHVFFICLVYALLRRRRVNYLELFLFCIIAILLWKCSQAKTNAVCIVILAVGMLVNKLIGEQWEEKYDKQLAWIRVAISCIPFLLCFVMIALACLYNTENEWTCYLDQIFNGRLRLGNNALVNYGIKIFGQYVQMIGMSWPVTNYEAYNFLDCSYMSILIRFGLAGLISVLLVLLSIIVRANKKKDMFFLGVTALLATQCVMEHHLHEIAYNPFLLAVFSEVCLVGQETLKKKNSNKKTIE